MSGKINKRKLVLEYDFADACTVLEYYKFFKKNLEEGNKIPARVLTKFVSLFTIEELRLNDELINLTGNVKQETLDRYSKDDEYIFNKKLLNTFHLAGSKVKSECSLQGMLKVVFDAIEHEFFDNNEKKQLIPLVYSSINKYFDMFKGNTIKLFSKYKRMVLTGYIAHKFGIFLSKEINEMKGAEPPNQLLYQATKHYTKEKGAK